MVKQIKWTDQNSLYGYLKDTKDEGYLIMDISELGESELNKIKTTLSRREGDIPLIFVSKNKKFAITKKLYNY